MRVYNIDFFDIDTMENIHHDMVAAEELSIDYDYLSPSTNEIEITKTDKLSKRNIVYIHGLYSYIGIITNIDTDDDKTTVSFDSFLKLFDHDAKFRFKPNFTYSLEQHIRDMIIYYWAYNGSDDPYQGLKTLSVYNVTIANISNPTNDWSLGIEAIDDDRPNVAICNLLSDVIEPALKKYGILVDVSLDFSNKCIKIIIDKVADDSATFMIDADQNNVEIESFSIQDPNTETNKLEIWDTNSLTYDISNHKKITYYLYKKSENGDTGPFSYKYGTSAPDGYSRITPVVIETTYTAESGEQYDDDGNANEDYKSFEEMAKEKAQDTFDGMDYENLIELKMSLEDFLINPQSMRFGTLVRIYHDGVSYASILTGKKIETEITLVFGSIRHDLTKILKASK